MKFYKLSQIRNLMKSAKICEPHKEAIISYIANSYITIRITNIPCNFQAGPYFNGGYTPLYATIF